MLITTLEDYKICVAIEVRNILDQFKGTPRKKWKDMLHTLLHEQVQNGNEIVDNEDNAIAVLRYSVHPTYGFTSGTGPTSSRDFKDPFNGTDSFPFRGFAACAFGQDVLLGVLAKLEARGISIDNL